MSSFGSLSQLTDAEADPTLPCPSHRPRQGFRPSSPRPQTLTRTERIARKERHRLVRREPYIWLLTIIVVTHVHRVEVEGDDGQADEAGCAGGSPDALRGLLVVGGFGVKDVGDEGLRVAVVEREEGGLDLDHDAVSGLEDVVDLREAEFDRAAADSGLMASGFSKLVR